MRKFIRHPTDIPLEYELSEVVAHQKDYLINISEGGISFQSGTYIEAGSVVNIRIPLREPVFEEKGIVKWCRKTKSRFEIGVLFRDVSSEFRLRMVEQVCHIEHYKKEILEKEGRKLTGEEAAVEWIRKYAKDFPR